MKILYWDRQVNHYFELVLDSMTDEAIVLKKGKRVYRDGEKKCLRNGL